MRKMLFAILTVATINVSAQDDSLTPERQSYLSIEVDPTPFIFGGYSFSLKYSPVCNNHVSIMGSVYSSSLPDKLLSKENYDKDFRDVKLNTSYALFADYFLKSNHTGFHFGPSAFFYSKTVGLNESTSILDFKSVYPNIRVGYVYKPFAKSGFYLNPWFNVGKEFIVDGSSIIEGKHYSTGGISYIVAIHLGYKVEF